jgi:hypothetical protein
MPLTIAGKKILESFKLRYGKKKGEKVFYAYMKAHPKESKKWHRQSKRKYPYGKFNFKTKKLLYTHRLKAEGVYGNEGEFKR